MWLSTQRLPHAITHTSANAHTCTHKRSHTYTHTNQHTPRFVKTHKYYPNQITHNENNYTDYSKPGTKLPNSSPNITNLENKNTAETHIMTQLQQQQQRLKHVQKRKQQPQHYHHQQQNRHQEQQQQ